MVEEEYEKRLLKGYGQGLLYSYFKENSHYFPISIIFFLLIEDYINFFYAEISYFPLYTKWMQLVFESQKYDLN